MSDTFSGTSTGKDSPADFCAAITPNDSTDLTIACRGVSCAAGGVVAFNDMNGEATDVTVVPGVIFPQRMTRILATGTTATGIRAHW